MIVYSLEDFCAFITNLLNNFYSRQIQLKYNFEIHAVNYHTSELLSYVLMSVIEFDVLKVYKIHVLSYIMVAFCILSMCWFLNFKI